MSGVLIRRPVAPDFPRGFTWWNTDRPLSFENDLKGRVVVLDFWTYCCINCLHIAANLKKVEQDFKDQPLVVIGVHSNKFTNEAEAANIRAAILRHRIGHPVVVDEGRHLWSAYGVNAWPTLVFVDAEGHVAGSVSGEVQPEEIESVVRALLDEARVHGTLADRPPLLSPEAAIPSASGLTFPGKIVADPVGGRLFIADSGHHQILVADRSGSLLQAVGSGDPGRADGPADKATFLDPQGMAFDSTRNLLYVADQGNHLVRRVDLKSARVETILGTGRQVYDRAGGGRGLAQGIDSPWDLALDGFTLYIAMAGTHQIWRMDLATLRAEAWVGSGREGLTDGPGYNAALAQPSGLTLIGPWLYFVDSESSALRRVRRTDGDVETLVGHGLFDFGDADGPFGRARLQHPLGLTTDGRDLYVADTYNHKLKRINLEERSVGTLAGAGQPGAGDPGGALFFHEPGGLAWLDGNLYVADTNNHRIVVVNAQNPADWRELTIRQAQACGPEDTLDRGYPSCAIVAEGSDKLVLEIEPALVEGFAVSAEAPQTVVVWEPEGQGGLLASPDRRLQCTVREGKYPVDLEIPIAPEHGGRGRFVVELSFASCSHSDHGLCKPEQRRWDVSWIRGSGPSHPIRLMGGMIGAA